MTSAAPGARGGTVEVSPATLDVTGLAPGAGAAREITVTNGSDVPVVVTAATTRQGALFDGATPLGLATTWSTGGPTCDGLPVVGAGDTTDLSLRVALPADAGNDYQGLTGQAVVTVITTELPEGACAAPGVVDPPGPGGPSPSPVPGDPDPDPGPGAAPGGPGDGSPGGGPGGGADTAGGVHAAPPGGDDLALTGAQAGSLLVTVVVLVAAGCALLRRRRDRAGAPGAAVAPEAPA